MAGGGQLSRDVADQTLAGLGAAYDRIAAAMFAVDSHSGLAFLRDTELSGATAARWRALRPEIDVLWAHFTTLGELLGRVRALRDRRRPGDEEWAELSRLLREPVVVLDGAGMPVEAPGPVGTARVAGASRWALWDFATALEQRCAAVTGQLSDVDVSFSGVVARLAPVVEALTTLTAGALDLGETETVDRLRSRVTNVQQMMLSDPLTAAPGGRPTAALDEQLDRLAADVDGERSRQAELVRLRDGFPERVTALRALIDQVAAAETAVAESCARATIKIADPHLPPLPTAARVLRSRLTEVSRTRLRGQWRTLADDVATLEQSAIRARQRADELREAVDGLLIRRDELRGRLDAYRVKAAGHGLAEDEELSARYREAHDLLYTAPCDLSAGTRAVVAYQRTLNGLLERGGGAGQGSSTGRGGGPVDE